ncbi:hypothetical protein AVEN_79324-1 [Araneus ventricosus]|uniref:Protein kinase domain-containing protein n=1 Tax=Araneus ventricosus TaxID=182803 RepID=A0A4Y2K1Z5_ARAVE|nr:hypothetical protein AVEN_79324-1 [Araneus ventricosus]
MYQPPETSGVLKDGKTVDGRRFDLWSFGIMSIELLTRFHMLRSYSSCYLGTDARYGSMKMALQEESFASKMQTALPTVKISNDNVQMALDFVHSFLRTDPSSWSRMTKERSTNFSGWETLRTPTWMNSGKIQMFSSHLGFYDSYKEQKCNHPEHSWNRCFSPPDKSKQKRKRGEEMVPVSLFHPAKVVHLVPAL